jgi:hypothetical protein
MTMRWRPRGVIVLTCAVLLIVVGVVVWVGTRRDPPAASATSTTSTTSTAPLAATKKLSVPHDSVAQDGQFLSEVTEADPALVTYEKNDGNIALRSLLTDGSAFCAFLNRDGNIDGAMVSVAEGAQQDESQTHLPQSVTTFNAIDAVALLTLCPSLEKVVPTSDLTKIRALGASLSATSP